MGYAVWSGIGIIGTSILGAIIFQENINLAKVLCIGLIFVGVIGLNLIKY